MELCEKEKPLTGLAAEILERINIERNHFIRYYDQWLYSLSYVTILRENNRYLCNLTY